MSRSQYKIAFYRNNLIKNSKKYIKIYNKNLIILSKYVNLNFLVYNGKSFVRLNINKDMINYKFGDFIYTRKKFNFKKK